MKQETTSWGISDWTVERFSDDQVVLTRIKVPKLDIKKEYTFGQLKHWLHTALDSAPVRAFRKEHNLPVYAKYLAPDKNVDRIEISRGDLCNFFNLYEQGSCARLSIEPYTRKFECDVEYFGWKGNKELPLPKKLAAIITKLAKAGE